MGIIERKERERREMMAVILEAAMQLYMEKGAANVSIRKIAERIEYSPATIYLYYRNRDDIFCALQNEAFAKFYTVLNTITTLIPLERLREVLHLYIRFAVNNPELYDIMFIMHAPMRSRNPKEPPVMGLKAYDVLRHTVALCMQKGDILPGDVEVLTFTFWAHIHGIASLLIRQRLSIFPTDVHDSLIEESIESILKNYSTQD
jgi:AcrR family transcriptional regulator